MTDVSLPLSAARHLSLLVPCGMADPVRVAQALLRSINLLMTDPEPDSLEERRGYGREAIVLLLSGVFGQPEEEVLDYALMWAEGITALGLVEPEPECP